MKKILLAAICITLVSELAAQGNPAAAVSPQGPPALPMFMEDINGRPYSSKGLEDIEGTPYLLPDWSWGAVKFRNGKFAKDISLQFSTYNNKLYFKKDNNQMEFVQPIQEFMIGTFTGGDSVAMIFRNGYPSTARTTGDTFFELLTDGTFQLLKYHVKQIRSFKPYNQPEKKQFAAEQEFYAYMQGGSIVKIKKDKEAIAEAFPGYAAAIRSIADQRKLKLKNEADLVQLFAELNKQTVSK